MTHLSIVERLDLRLKGLPVPELNPVDLRCRNSNGHIKLSSQARQSCPQKWNGFIPQPKILSDSEAKEIQRLYGTGEYFQRELAAKFSVSKATIQHVIWGKGAYRHLRNAKSSNFATDW